MGAEYSAIDAAVSDDAVMAALGPALQVAPDWDWAKDASARVAIAALLFEVERPRLALRLLGEARARDFGGPAWIRLHESIASLLVDVGRPADALGLVAAAPIATSAPAERDAVLK